MSKTTITDCVCDHSYQDKQYGKSMRIHNVSGKKGEEDRHTCTVCGRVYKGKSCIKTANKK